MSSQTTSIVHDFAVLFSTRVHQKDKKWSDGRLKFYEFNNKIEIYSSENFLVTIDFYPSASRQPIESGAFSDGNEYRLPNGKLVVEIEEYLGCSERDISKVFKKATQRDPVKREPGIIKETPRVKMESHDSSPLIPVKHKIRRVGLSRREVKKSDEFSILKKQNLRVARNQPEVTSFVRPLSLEEKLNRYANKNPNTNLRIPPRSNRLYIRLYKEMGIGETKFIKVRTPEIEEPIGTVAPSILEPVIKQEPVQNFEGKSVDEADIIHDLSEFEEDEVFLDMLQELNANKVLNTMTRH